MKEEQHPYFLVQAYTAVSLSRGLELPVMENHEKSYRIIPGDPITFMCGSPQGLIIQRGIWGIQEGAQTTTTIPSRKLLGTKPFSLLIRKSRCVVPVNALVVESKAGCKLIRVLGHRIIGLAGVVKTTRRFGSQKHEVTLLGVESPDILQSVQTIGPAFLTLSQSRKWVSPLDLTKVFEYTDRGSGLWFDYFDVSQDYTDQLVVGAADLRPLGLSAAQIAQRERELRALSIKSLRQNRTGK